MELSEKAVIVKLRDMAEQFMACAIEQRESDNMQSFGCFKYSETLKTAADKLERQIPQEMELEGGGTTWWYVCPECHGAIDDRDKFCRHCGQAVHK